MDITIYPRKLHGSIAAIPSKSQAHRLLICAALADRETTLICPETNRDIEATAHCLQALGAGIRRTNQGYHVEPINTPPAQAVLNCGESGSTLRFLLPLVGALGIDTTIRMEGRLPQRPLSPLWEEMERMGCKLSRPTDDTIRCQGQLRPGVFNIDGSVSSQFITGLLFAASVLDGDSRIHVTGKLESTPYVAMTQLAMALFGVDTTNFCVSSSQYHSPGSVIVEGDWSNAAFWLTAAALGNDITVTHLNADSAQGDRTIARLLPELKDRITISTADIPDLVPILSVAAAVNQGAVFTEIGRLRLKESDRVASVIAMLEALGGKAEADAHTLTVHPARFVGGTVDAHNDHRIAMAAAIAATVCDEPVTIRGYECVQKSYPGFWEEYDRIGGKYELYLR